jgi:uncharacterized protein (DUF1015 family)
MGITNAKLTEDERRMASNDKFNYRHTLSKKASSTNQAARKWVARRLDDGVLQRVDEVVMVYRQQDGQNSSLGVIADVSLAKYDGGLVRRHEATIATSEKRMGKYMARTRVFTNPVALTYRIGQMAELANLWATGEPDVALEAKDGSQHDLWLVGGSDATAICEALSEPLYITDGHHRLAAAASLATKELRVDFMPAGIFATDQLNLQSFARCFRSLPISPEALIDSIAAKFAIHEVGPSDARPARGGQIGARIGTRYLRIDLPEQDPQVSGPESLDANRLQDLILEPLLGVEDPRESARIEFIEGNATFDLDCYKTWFLPFPEAVESVLQMADQGLTMPPKSTLFGPKVPGGLAIRFIDG